MDLTKRFLSWFFRVFGIIFIIISILLFFLSSSVLNITNSLEDINNTIDNVVNETLSSQQSISLPYLLKVSILADLEKECEDDPNQPICKSGRGQIPVSAKQDIMDKISDPIKSLIGGLVTPKIISQLKFWRVASIVLWLLGILFWLTGSNFKWRKFLVKAGITNGICFFFIGALLYILKNKSTTNIIDSIKNTIPLDLSYEFLEMFATIIMRLVGEAIGSLYVYALVGFIISIITAIAGGVFMFIQHRKSKEVDVIKKTS